MLTAKAHREPDLPAIQWSRLLADSVLFFIRDIVQLRCHGNFSTRISLFYKCISRVSVRLVEDCLPMLGSSFHNLMHFLTDSTRILRPIEHEKRTFGISSCKVAQELINGFIECFGATPELTFRYKHVPVIHSNQDVRFT
jgi:hypothetical protein